MSSPQDRQVSIIQQKMNLDEIINQIKNNVLHRLPYLNEEEQRQIEKTMKALCKARAQAAEINQLQQKLGQLQAKQARLNQECIQLMERSQRARRQADELLRLIAEQQEKENQYQRYYEAELKKRFIRNLEQAYVYYEELVKSDTEASEAALETELQPLLQRRENELAQMKTTLDEMTPNVPENILQIAGEEELEATMEKLKEMRIAHTAPRT